MLQRNSPDGKIWEKEYSVRGSLWGGAIHTLPALPVSSRVLELGCGNGKTLGGMLRKGWDVVATDFSPAAVKLSRKIASPGFSCEIVLSDAGHIPFRPGSFDCVFAWHLLGHMSADDRRHCTGEIARVLRPQGRLFFSEFSEKDFRFGNGQEIEPGTFLRGTGVRTHYFSENEVRNFFSSFGIESIAEPAWTLRVRGINHVRSEIQAVFFKKDC